MSAFSSFSGLHTFQTRDLPKDCWVLVLWCHLLYSKWSSLSSDFYVYVLDGRVIWIFSHWSFYSMEFVSSIQIVYCSAPSSRFSPNCTDSPVFRAGIYLDCQLKFEFIWCSALSFWSGHSERFAVKPVCRGAFFGQRYCPVEKHEPLTSTAASCQHFWILIVFYCCRWRRS